MTDLIDKAQEAEAEAQAQLSPENLPIECCTKCKFWLKQPPEAQSILGYCRRFPPTPFIARFFWDQNDPNKNIGNSQVTTFPFTHPAQWCGEFKRDIKGVN